MTSVSASASTAPWASDMIQFQVQPQLSLSNSHVPSGSLKLVVQNSLCDVLRRSSILPRDCDGARLDDNAYVPLLVTTTGRSGTDFVQGLLASLRYTAMHDNAEGTRTEERRVGKEGRARWSACG